MTQGSLITEELRRAIGYEAEPITIEIDSTLLKRFADAVGDPNPIWHDEEKARGSRFGGVIAPPSLLCAALMLGELPVDSLANILPPRRLDGGAEWEVFQPIRPGDRITVNTRLTDMTERQGRIGPMLLVTFGSAWQNQHGEVVAKSIATAICY